MVLDGDDVKFEVYIWVVEDSKWYTYGSARMRWKPT